MYPWMIFHGIIRCRLGESYYYIYYIGLDSIVDQFGESSKKLTLSCRTAIYRCKCCTWKTPQRQGASDIIASKKEVVEMIPSWAERAAKRQCPCPFSFACQVVCHERARCRLIINFRYDNAIKLLDAWACLKLRPGVPTCTLPGLSLLERVDRLYYV